MRKVVKAKVFIRKDTSSNWEYNNPILASGQIGFDTTVGKHKIGNGEKRWRELPYFILETDQIDITTTVTFMSFSVLQVF